PRFRSVVDVGEVLDLGVGELELDAEEPEVARLGTEPLEEALGLGGVLGTHGSDVDHATVPEDDVELVLGGVYGHGRNLVENLRFQTGCGRCVATLVPRVETGHAGGFERRDPGHTVNRRGARVWFLSPPPPTRPGSHAL